MRYSLLFLLLFVFKFSFAQDVYHTELVTFLSENFQIENPSYLLNNTEEANIQQRFNYGAVNVQNENVTNQSFSIQSNCAIAAGQTNAWDAGMGNGSNAAVNIGDVVLVTFWAKRNSSSADIFMFAEDNVSYEKEYYFTSELSPDWSQYFLAFKSSKNYPSGRLAVGFHFGSQAQDVDIAGFTALNYGDAYSVDDVPNTYSPSNYGGHEEDAAWRALAQSRIESIRKSDLKVSVVDQNGNAVEGADVRIEMQEHAFGFGSAFVTCRFPGNDCHNPIYVEKITNLDGKGHGFNVGVTENSLKWDGWEEEWLGSPEEIVSSIEYLTEQGVKMRGHTLLWPGWDLMPNDIVANADNLDYILDRINGRINSMINHPVLKDIITDWDVLNEITTNDDLEKAFDNYPNYESGVDLYKYVLEQVRASAPDMPMYINDYVILSGAGSSEIVSNRYKGLLNELKEADVPFDGIGFQCHIGSLPTSILKLKQVWDEFDQRYGVPLKVTEYDVNPTVSEEVQAKYMEDFLTMCFSHPSMEAFLMWGFWDGNHWKDNAPLYDFNWNLKPSGQAFVDKVFNEWWTEENSMSNTVGEVDFRPFKGKHKIIVSKGSALVDAEINLDSSSEIEIVLDLSTSVNELTESDITLLPNPTSIQAFKIHLPEGEKVELQITNASGKLVKTIPAYRSGEHIDFDVEAGIYLVKINTKNRSFTKRLIVQ